MAAIMAVSMASIGAVLLSAARIQSEIRSNAFSWVWIIQDESTGPSETDGRGGGFTEYSIVARKSSN